MHRKMFQFLAKNTARKKKAKVRNKQFIGEESQTPISIHRETNPCNKLSIAYCP